MRNSYIGVEIGASKHHIALGDTEGNLLKQKAGKVVLEEGAEGILAWMRQHIRSMISEAHAELIEPIRQRVDEIVFSPDKGRYDIRLAALMDDAVLVGAVMAAGGRTVALGA